jgi:hypothetical protein
MGSAKEASGRFEVTTLGVQNLRKLQISAAIEKAQSKRAERVAATADPTTIAAEI